MAALDHLQPLAQFEFTFKGFDDVRGVSAAGMNMPEVDKETVVEEAREWYGA